MDFTEHVPFGKIGLLVSRIGMASGYGAPVATFEKAFHEYGINLFWVAPLRKGANLRALRNLIPEHSDEIRIMLALPAFASFWLEGYVERTLRKIGIEQADMVVLQDLRKPPSPKVLDTFQRLKDRGLTRYVGLSSHERPLLGAIARGEVEAPLDFFQARYNAVHTGAEQDIFPHLPPGDRPGMLTFTATCWRKLLKPKLMPAGEQLLDPADCFRFVLSHPDVDACLTGPANTAQLEENMRALKAGPLDDGELPGYTCTNQQQFEGGLADLKSHVETREAAVEQFLSAQ